MSGRWTPTNDSDSGKGDPGKGDPGKDAAVGASLIHPSHSETVSCDSSGCFDGVDSSVTDVSSGSLSFASDRGKNTSSGNR